MTMQRAEPADRLKRMPPDSRDDSHRVWGRIVQRDEWAFTKGSVTMVDDWQHGPSIRYDTHPVDAIRYRQRRPDAALVETDGVDVLDEFFELFGPMEGYRNDRKAFVAERGKAVRKFVRRRGPLGLCARHGAPLGHGHDIDRDDPRCLLGGLEPLSLWWGVIRWALAVRDLAVQLHDGRAGDPDDWAAIGWSEERRASDNRLPRERLASAINLALAAASPRPVVRWGPGSKPEFQPYTSTGSPLYASIVLHLALVVTGVMGLARCSVCGRPYPLSDGERRPREASAFCSQKCRRRRAADNAKAYRERKRSRHGKRRA